MVGCSNTGENLTTISRNWIIRISASRTKIMKTPTDGCKIEGMAREMVKIADLFPQEYFYQKDSIFVINSAFIGIVFTFELYVIQIPLSCSC